MPISALDGASAEHWMEVRTILTDAVESILDPKFTVRIVSDADETGIIQKRIVQNVYGSDIIVCDVSGKNPNVMFELGMRLAFDKPVVIVKDDKTDYAFDTGIIEHLTYPRDLRFTRILEFKNALAAKVLATHKAGDSPDHSPFLKNFGRFHVASLSETEISPEKLTLELLEELRREIARLGRRITAQTQLPVHKPPFDNLPLREYVADYMTRNPSKPASGLLADEEFLVGAFRAVEPMGTFLSIRDAREALVHEMRMMGLSDQRPTLNSNPSSSP
jgi:hypothetical protein